MFRWTEQQTQDFLDGGTNPTGRVTILLFDHCFLNTARRLKTMGHEEGCTSCLTFKFFFRIERTHRDRQIVH